MSAPLVFISWQPYCSRSDNIARVLGGGASYKVYDERWGSRYGTIAFKYAIQAWQTWRLLRRDRPRVVVVMTPSTIACLPVWWYCLLHRARYVIDAHTAAFVVAPWQQILWLHRFFSRRAVTTIVTNEHFARLIESWGASATIVTDVPVRFARPEPRELPPGPRMTLVSSFTYDEPLAEFLAAAAAVPDVRFYVTGNYKKADPALVARKPANVEFTGFLSDGQYVGLLEASDAVLALTTYDHTMQRGAYEAIYLGKPVITSNFGLLRSAFPQGTVHVDATPEDIRRGIAEMRADLPRFQAGALALREAKWARAQGVFGELARRLGVELQWDAGPGAHSVDAAASSSVAGV